MKRSRNLDTIEHALPNYLEAARVLANALEPVQFHFEMTQLTTFVGNVSSQIEIAASLSMKELRSMVGAIHDGAAPIPGAKPAPAAVVEPPPPSMTVFMLRSAHYRDRDGRKHFVGQWEDAIMPVATAQRALRLRVAVPVADPRRTKLRGSRGGDFNSRAPDVIDLDEAVEEPTSLPHVNPVLRAANFTVIDRSAEARTIFIDVPRS